MKVKDFIESFNEDDSELEVVVRLDKDYYDLDISEHYDSTRKEAIIVIEAFDAT